MKILGLIMEINPLHNGHIYFINQAKAVTNPDITIVVMSSSFTMRGETMVIDKFSRTRFLLNNGIDLVFELPFLSAVNSADLFGINTISILKDLNVTDIAFGTELMNLEKLNRITEILELEEFNNQLKTFSKLGHSYSASAFKSLALFTKDKDILEKFSLPNNTLAIQYIRAIKKLNFKVSLFPIQRIGDNYYDKTITSKIASATAIRELIKTKIPLNKYVPDEVAIYNFKNLHFSEKRIFEFLKFTFIHQPLQAIASLYGVNEGIEKRLLSTLNDSLCYNVFMDNVVSKRYSHYRIQRTILHILLKTPKELQNKSNYYLRLLGSNEGGFKYINKLPKDVKKKIITSLKNLEDNIIVEQELKATKLYDLITDSITLQEEYKTPIKKGE